MYVDWGEVTPRWDGVRSETIEVQGTPVHVLRAGDGREGPPQLLVHGLGGSAANWIEVMPALARRGPVVAPDLPGFGRTPPPTRSASRVRHNARFLRALLDELGWEQAEVHGNSMGGMVSVLFADREPERVSRLVLVSPALPSSSLVAARLDPATLQRFAPFVVPGLGEILLRRAWARVTPEEYWDDLLPYLYADPNRVAPEVRRVGIENLQYGREVEWRLPGFVGAAESVVGALLRRGRLEAAVTGVAAPTLLVWGDADRLVGRVVIDAVRDRRPDWTVTLLEGIGHVPMIETPELYVELLERWLDGDEVPARIAA
jgi:pimeloyl-ACP methyl ester carboxylesterase